MLAVLSMAACKKEAQETTRSEAIVRAEYAMRIETNGGNQLFPNVIRPDDIRIEYTTPSGEQKKYYDKMYDWPNGVAYRPGNDMVILAVINSEDHISDLPLGLSTVVNYIHWSDDMVDKVEITMSNYEKRVIETMDIKINGELVWTRTPENYSYEPSIIKTIDANGNASYRDVTMVK